jgi:hypothetical protein
MTVAWRDRDPGACDTRHTPGNRAKRLLHTRAAIQAGTTDASGAHVETTRNEVIGAVLP